MTKWQPIAFADVKVGDKVKSVSPCGTVRRGVVAELDHEDEGYLTDAEGNYVVRPDWTLYRRAPKFTPLDVPTVGQWGEFTMQNGQIRVGVVASVQDLTKASVSPCWSIRSAHDLLGHIDARGDLDDANRIISWRPTTPPAPEEPNGFGYVGDVTNKDGEARCVFRRNGLWVAPYVIVRIRDGAESRAQDWPDVLRLGTFTAVNR